MLHTRRTWKEQSTYHTKAENSESGKQHKVIFTEKIKLRPSKASRQMPGATEHEVRGGRRGERKGRTVKRKTA
jgi:hypothetical protein